MAEVFMQQADVAANSALVAVEGGGHFCDFGVVVVGAGGRGIEGFRDSVFGHSARLAKASSWGMSIGRAAAQPWIYSGK